MYMYIYQYVYIYICIHAYIYIYIHIYIYRERERYIHTYIYIYIYIEREREMRRGVDMYRRSDRVIWVGLLGHMQQQQGGECANRADTIAYRYHMYRINSN